MPEPTTQAVIAGAAQEPLALDLWLPAEGDNLPLVVICHGFKGFKDWGLFPHLAARLAAGGLAALSFNFSHNGVGQGAQALAFTRLDLFQQDRMSYRLFDVQAVWRAVQEKRLAGAERVAARKLGLFGHSLGGAVALLATRELPARALATLASVDHTSFSKEQEQILEREGRLLIPNQRTGQMMPLGRAALDDLRRHPERFNLERAANHLACPWLILHGEADRTVPPAAARHLQSLAQPHQARLEIIPGADHVMNVRHPWGGSSPAFERLAELTVSFFQQLAD